jgi:N-acetylmuramoyl-L-alanine amidase
MYHRIISYLLKIGLIVILCITMIVSHCGNATVPHNIQIKYDFSWHNLIVSEANAAFDMRPIDENSIEWLAKTIYHESRGEPKEGKIAVAMVTLNRVHSPRWPKSVREVVQQRGQYPWISYHSRITDKVAWNESKELARYVFMNYNTILDPTKGSTYFDRVDSCNRYKQPMVKIGHHVFCRQIGDPIFNAKYDI